MAGKRSGVPKTTNKQRFIFTIDKDLILLRTALQCNPWQLGNDQWAIIKSSLDESLAHKLAKRTIKDRITLLVDKYQKQQLTTKTGTEEMQSQRGDLLESIIGLIEESRTPINEETGADPDNEIEVVFHDIGEELEQTGASTSSAAIAAANKKTEKIEADRERDFALAGLDMAPEPNGIRRKRFKLSAEDELIRTKQDHDMIMDNKRLDLEVKSQDNHFKLEEDRIQLEKARLDMEERREARLADENRQRNDLQIAQIDFQKTMCSILNKLVDR